MRHIEFLGLPAAGKTTLVENLLRGNLAVDRAISAPLTRAPVTVDQKLSKRYRDLISVSLQLLGSPVRSWRIWRACGVFKQPSASLWLRMCLSCLRVDRLARSASGRAGEDRLVILDQGVYQAVWSLALRAEFRSEEQFVHGCRQLLACLAVPALVVLVDTPADVALRRLASEPAWHGRLPKLLESDPGWMRRTQEILAILWGIADSDPLVRTLRYTPDKDTLNDVEHAVRALSDPGERSSA